VPPDLRSWLLDRVLPYWAERAYGARDGGYVSELTPDGEVADIAAPKTCLVNARLLYCFSHARCLGAGMWAETAARRTLDFLLTRLHTPEGGWRSSTAAGPSLFDLYDHAFVLFGLAWWHRASGDASAIALATQAMAFLDRALADATNGGWHETDTHRLPRRQNPHMHLLEAFHALFESTGDPAWLNRAKSVVRLFDTRFFDRDTGTLREFLNPDLSPLDDPSGRVREPGHHMEWVWLLLHHRRLTGDDGVLAPAEALYQSAIRHGIDARGLLIETMDATGQPIDRSTLLWPQTEAVKAALARHEFLGADLTHATSFLEAMFRYHVPEDSPLWINRLSETGAPLSETVPTRVLYHLVLGLAEWLRVNERTRPQALRTKPK
jgi:mannose/cellobiose epimerase-like protein (N-acyl-D-glucosamine 2-epimerase family)